MTKPTPAAVESYGCSLAFALLVIGAAVRLVWGMFKD
jgi:hypothetical protein